MIAEVTPSASSSAVPVNWFDVVLVIVLLFGLFRGKRNGMSKELLPLLQWVVLVPVCGFGYPVLGGIFVRSFGMSTFWGFLTAYLALAFVVFLVFALLRRQFAERLGKSSFFKDGEYYLGMVAGAVRYACALVFVLALLNARFFTPNDIARAQARDMRDLGGGLFKGNYFPHLFTIQDMVFKQSMFGPIIKKDLAVLLISTHGAGPGSQKGAVGAPQKKPMIEIGTNIIGGH